MNDHTPEQPATPPPPEHPPAVPAADPRKYRSTAVIVGSAAAVIAAVVATGIIVVGKTDDSKPARTIVSEPAVDDATDVEEEAAPKPTYADIDAEDFTMDLRTTDRQCFGSAGCNVTVQPKLTYNGFTQDLDPDAVYEITYEIRGDESGPIIATAELSDQTTLNFRPSLVSTRSSAVKITVKITDVVTQGA
ncbi:hypothetical protein [Streptomyces sp. NPDC001536]|uniref:hypothetical protein n=1 Tax=Streptomyces sp. NPDC001536 TaxID=3364583 RepID=UPI00368F0D1F